MRQSAVVKAESTPAERFQMYVDGQWVGAEDHRTFDSRHRPVRRVAHFVPDGGIPETRLAIESAHRAFPARSRTLAKDRGVILKRIMELINAGRNSVIGPGLFDFSLFKNNYFPKISESFNVQFRVEFFNILNRPTSDRPLRTVHFSIKTEQRWAEPVRLIQHLQTHNKFSLA
jgi:hypothetical protein